MKDEDNNLEVNNNAHEDNINQTANNPFNENEQISFNDTNGIGASVVNSPVPITSSDQIGNKEEGSEGGSQLIQKLKLILNPITKQFLKLGNIFQSLLSKLSDKIQVQQSYKYFLIFLALGLLLLFFALLCIPFVIFNPGKLLRLLSFGNIFIMLCFLFYYGSKDFFAFLIDPKRTGVMFGHIVGLFTSLFVSLFIGGYFLQLLLDAVLCITTVMFILTLIPGGQEGIAGIKRMLISPLMLLFNTFKGKIFGDNASA
jgi:hypothetical protein